MKHFEIVMHIDSMSNLMSPGKGGCSKGRMGLYDRRFPFLIWKQFSYSINIEYLIYNYITSYSILFAYNVLKRYLVGFSNMLFRSKKHPTLGQMHSMLKRTKNGRRQGDSLLYRYSFVETLISCDRQNLQVLHSILHPSRTYNLI